MYLASMHDWMCINLHAFFNNFNLCGRMCPLMTAGICRCWEALSTITAFVRFFTRMHTLVPSKFMSGCVRSITGVTLKYR